LFAPSPPTDAGAFAATWPSALDAEASGFELIGPLCTVPDDPEVLFPPPTWTAPVESEARLSPEPPTATGALASTVVPDAEPSTVALVPTPPT